MPVLVGRLIFLLGFLFFFKLFNYSCPHSPPLLSPALPPTTFILSGFSPLPWPVVPPQDRSECTKSLQRIFKIIKELPLPNQNSEIVLTSSQYLQPKCPLTTLLLYRVLSVTPHVHPSQLSHLGLIKTPDVSDNIMTQ